MRILYMAIKISMAIATMVFSLVAGAVARFKRPTDDPSSGSGQHNYVLILDPMSPSLVPIPVCVVTGAIKQKVPVGAYAAVEKAECRVCLDRIGRGQPIRELVNCKHVFHRECLDRWVDEGQVTCPLCRSMLLPPNTDLRFWSNYGKSENKHK